jgi:predicted nucleotidyltransferase
MVMVVARIEIPMAKIEAFCRKWNLSEFSLFGSILRDDFGADSDVDVLIAFKPGSAMTLEGYIGMTDELRPIFGREIDLVEKRFVRNPFRRYEILTTRQVLYVA